MSSLLAKWFGNGSLGGTAYTNFFSREKQTFHSFSISLKVIQNLKGSHAIVPPWESPSRKLKVVKVDLNYKDIYHPHQTAIKLQQPGWTKLSYWSENLPPRDTAIPASNLSLHQEKPRVLRSAPKLLTLGKRKLSIPKCKSHSFESERRYRCKQNQQGISVRWVKKEERSAMIHLTQRIDDHNRL